jgi:hypothetical protein
MWRPKKLGHVVAERRFRFDGAKGPRHVLLRFGRPVRAPKASPRDPWWCPIEVSGLGGLGVSRVRAVAGEDSLQALILALEFAANVLPFEAATAGGHLEWLGERERLVFADTIVRGLAARGLENMAAGLAEAVAVLERGGARAPSTRKLVSELKALAASGGHSRRSPAGPRSSEQALPATGRTERAGRSKIAARVTGG